MQRVIDNRSRQVGEVSRGGWQKLRGYVMPALVLGLALLFMNGRAILSDIGFIEFKTLLITGNFRFVQVGYVQEIAKEHAKAGFLRVNLVGLRESVKRIEWVRDARVRREWPATLVIEITEETPVAVWRSEKLLNANGEIFGSTRAEFETLPRLDGPDGTQSYLLTRYGQFKSILGGTELDFAKLTLSNRRSFRLETFTGVTVILGVVDIDGRLQRFARHAAPLLATHGKKIEQLDFRYSNGFAVKWNQPFIHTSELNKEEDLNAQEI